MLVGEYVRSPELYPKLMIQDMEVCYEFEPIVRKFLSIYSPIGM